MSEKIYRRHLKRLFDLSAAILALLLIWPFLLLIYLLLRLSIGASVIFRQERPGFMGRPFIIYKYRTMTNERDSSGRLLPDKDRITRVGQFLRSFSLDELPEIFNVLKADMSLVGPRPLMMQYLERYTPDWFTYQNEGENHSLLHIGSEIFDQSPILEKYSLYSKMTDNEYLAYFKNNRRKKFLIPIYKDYKAAFTNDMYTWFLKNRARFARFLAKFRLIKWAS